MSTQVCWHRHLFISRPVNWWLMIPSHLVSIFFLLTILRGDDYDINLKIDIDVGLLI